MPKISINNKEYKIQMAVAELIDALQREIASLTGKVKRREMELEETKKGYIGAFEEMASRGDKVASLTEKVERLEGENKRTSQGWVCPKCGSVYAIWVAQCSICRPKVVAADTTDWQLG